jgi:hypothetical protein
VLTAAHCIDHVSDPSALGFHIGANLERGDFGLRHEVLKLALHPAYGASADGAPENDVALAYLSVAPDVSPVVIATTSPVSGTPVSLIGYGQMDDQLGGTGVKRLATNLMEKVTGMTIRYAGSGGGVGNLCFGDSGGPTLATYGGQEVVVGVHSYVSSTDPSDVCGSFGNDMRIDLYRTWLSDAAGAGGISVESSTTDNQAPLVAFVDPKHGAIVSAQLNVRIEASDDRALDYVELVHDGVWAGRKTGAPFIFDLELIPGNTVVLEAQAVDKVGLRATAFVVVQVEAERPATPPSPPGIDPGEGSRTPPSGDPRNDPETDPSRPTDPSPGSGGDGRPPRPDGGAGSNPGSPGTGEPRTPGKDPAAPSDPNGTGEPEGDTNGVPPAMETPPAGTADREPGGTVADRIGCHLAAPDRQPFGGGGLLLLTLAFVVRALSRRRR